jgi:hypothetical protein
MIQLGLVSDLASDLSFELTSGLVSGGGGGGVIPPVTDPASGSIHFPQVNFVDTDDRSGGAIISVDADSMNGAGEEILKPSDEGAMGFIVDMNWLRTNQVSGQKNFIAGNDASPSGPRTFEIVYTGTGGSYGTGNHVIVFDAKGESADDRVTLEIDLTSSLEDRIFLLFRIDTAVGANGTCFWEAYSCEDGSQLASSSVLISAANGWNGCRTRNNWAIGGRCSNTTGAFLKTGNVTCFNGGIGLFFIYSGGVAITTTNAQNIALGESITSELGTNNFRMAYQFTDPTDPNEPIDNAVSGTNPPVSISTEGGYSLSVGNSLCRQSSSEYLTLDYIHDGKIFGVPFGLTSSTFSLSGYGSSNGETVQVRVYSKSDGTVALDWTDVGTVSSGSWSGSVPVPLTKGWVYIDARIKSDPDNLNTQAYHRNKTGSGYEVALLGQSQMDIWAETLQTTGAVSPSGESTVSYFGLIDKNGANVRAYCEVVSDETQILSSGLVATALYLDSITDVPVKIVGHHEEGTGMTQWVDDSDPTRKWSDSEVLALAAGNTTSIVLHQWGTSDSGFGTNYEELVLDPCILGSDPGGLPYTLNHSVYNSPDVGDDVFAQDSKAIMCPLSRHGIQVSNDPAIPYDESEPPSESQLTSCRELRQELESFNLANLDADSGVWFNDMTLDDNDRGPHQAFDDERGNPRMGVRLAQSIAKGLSLESISNPEFDSVARSGDTITATFTLPNGGTLVAGSNQTGGSVPGGEQPIQGFEVSEDSGTTWTRSGFTTSITSAALGTVDIIRDSGTWAAGTLMRYCYGGPVAFDANYEDIVEGLLYEARGTEGSRGIATSIEVGIPASGAKQLTAT